MTKIFIQCVLLAGFGCFGKPVFSQNENPPRRFFYVDWNHRTKMIEVGSFDSKLKNQQPFLKMPISELSPAVLENWLGEKNTAGALLYFHCMWGNEPHFHRKSLRSLRQILENGEPKSPQTVIAFLWKSGGLNYAKNWNAAAEKGEPLAPLVALILEKFQGETTVFSHSMGNRFFEGAVRQIPENQQLAPIQNWIMMSPDLDANLADPDFLHTASLAKNRVVFCHRRDRALWFSTQFLNKKRLGKALPEGEISASFQPEILDITSLGWGISNHAHFLNTRRVQQLIASKF